MKANDHIVTISRSIVDDRWIVSVMKKRSLRWHRLKSDFSYLPATADDPEAFVLTAEKLAEILFQHMGNQLLKDKTDEDSSSK